MNIRWGWWVVLNVDVVEGMRREISHTKKRMRLFLADEFCG